MKAVLFLLWLPLAAAAAEASTHVGRTSVSIAADEFQINGQPTYAGRTWNGHKIQGLLLNARLVQGLFDDLNTNTVARWKYPDTGQWDAERNTREFLAAMPEWRRHGLLAFTINLQGGMPAPNASSQPWLNSAFTSEGALRPEYMARLERILNRAGLLTQRYGAPLQIGVTKAISGYADVSALNLRRMQLQMSAASAEHPVDTNAFKAAA